MGMVMIRCPRTGREIATGLLSDRSQFACTPVFFADSYCSDCDSQHRWFARDAWVSEEHKGFATAA